MATSLPSGTDDPDVYALLAAQKSPPNWIVYRVLKYTPHGYTHIGEIGTDESRCAYCPFIRQDHPIKRDQRLLILLVNGPLRRLTFYAETAAELPKNARNWLNTLHNVASAVNVRIDAWVAYDGRGESR